MRLTSIQLVLLAAAAASVVCGCDTQHDLYTRDIRRENGLVVILPGIEGTSGFNLDIRRGLQQAGCYRSMPIYNWGMPVPGVGMLIKQTGLGNRWSARNIAKRICEYIDTYPNRPLYLIGHSGGGGLAVLIAEEMPEDKPLDGLILLNASISKGYDLQKALSRCRKGIVNFYNPSDVGLLAIGTTIVGNIDGAHGPSAGLLGFDYGDEKLYQVELTDTLTSAFGGGAHDAATRPGFVSRYVAPWVLNSVWREELLDVPVTRHGPNPTVEESPQPLDKKSVSGEQEAEQPEPSSQLVIPEKPESTSGVEPDEPDSAAETSDDQSASDDAPKPDASDGKADVDEAAVETPAQTLGRGLAESPTT